MHGLLKKYGSQLFEVESLPETEGKSVIRLSRLDSLVQISEDLRCPVLYVADADGVPKQGHFLVSGDTVCYEYVLESRMLLWRKMRVRKVEYNGSGSGRKEASKEGFRERIFCIYCGCERKVSIHEKRRIPL